MSSLSKGWWGQKVLLKVMPIDHTKSFSKGFPAPLLIWGSWKQLPGVLDCLRAEVACLQVGMKELLSGKGEIKQRRGSSKRLRLFEAALWSWHRTGVTSGERYEKPVLWVRKSSLRRQWAISWAFSNIVGHFLGEAMWWHFRQLLWVMLRWSYMCRWI